MKPFRFGPQRRSAPESSVRSEARWNRSGLARHEQPTEHRRDRLFLNRQRRLAWSSPDLLIRVGEERIDDVTETRSGVGAVLVAELFSSDLDIRHNGTPRELYRGTKGRGTTVVVIPVRRGPARTARIAIGLRYRHL